MATIKPQSLFLHSSRHAFRYLLLLLSLLNGAAAIGQVYFTRNGTITVSGTYRGRAIAATSHQLHVRIHYNTSEIHMHLRTSSLNPRNDSLQALFSRWADKDVWFTGTIKTGPLPTRPHPKQPAPIQGALSLNGFARTYSLNSTLIHLSDGSIRCVLSGELTINLNHFGVPTAPFENQVQVSFRQLVLSSPGAQ